MGKDLRWKFSLRSFWFAQGTMLTEFPEVLSICRHGSRCILSRSISSGTFHDYFVAVSSMILLPSQTSIFAVTSGRRGPFPFQRPLQPPSKDLVYKLAPWLPLATTNLYVVRDERKHYFLEIICFRYTRK